MTFRQIISWALLVSGVWGIEDLAFAEQPTQYGKFDQLTLTLEIPKHQVHPLEPLGFKLRLENKTAKPIQGFPCLEPSCDNLGLHVTKPGQPMEEIERLTWDSSGGAYLYGAGVIAPAASFQDQWVYDIGLDDYFSEPGVYHVKAKFWNANDEFVESPPVVLHVTEPVGVEKLAFEYVRDAYPGRPTRLWFASDKVEELVLLYPGTTYARHAGFIVGMRAKRKNNWKKAVEYLTPPAEHPDFPLADEALETLTMFHKSRNPEKAQAYQQMINTRFPHSQYAAQK